MSASSFQTAPSLPPLPLAPRPWSGPRVPPGRDRGAVPVGGRPGTHWVATEISDSEKRDGMSQPTHPLRGLLVAQFLGAFNDNAWKLIVALLAIRAIAPEVGTSGPAFEAAAQRQTTMAFFVFALPLMLVSIPAGVLADRLSKRTVIIMIKALEVCLMTGGTIALLVHPSGWVFPLVVLGLMGVHSALFSPAKYGILPEILPHERLSSGNGLLVMWTQVAIISGTVAGGAFLDWAGGAPWTTGVVLTVLAGLGFIASWTVPQVRPARSEGGIATTVKIAWG